jgi:hypothetical protein
MKRFLSKKFAFAVFLIVAQLLAACAPTVSLFIAGQAPIHPHTAPDSEQEEVPSNSDISISQQMARKDKIDSLVFQQTVRRAETTAISDNEKSPFNKMRSIKISNSVVREFISPGVYLKKRRPKLFYHSQELIPAELIGISAERIGILGR